MPKIEHYMFHKNSAFGLSVLMCSPHEGLSNTYKNKEKTQPVTCVCMPETMASSSLTTEKPVLYGWAIQASDKTSWYLYIFSENSFTKAFFFLTNQSSFNKCHEIYTD